MILGCTCIHNTQDEIHGKGKRVFNERKSGSFRCTVCKKEVSATKEKAVKK